MSNLPEFRWLPVQHPPRNMPRSTSRAHRPGRARRRIADRRIRWARRPEERNRPSEEPRRILGRSARRRCRRKLHTALGSTPLATTATAAA